MASPTLPREAGLLSPERPPSSPGSSHLPEVRLSRKSALPRESWYRLKTNWGLRLNSFPAMYWCPHQVLKATERLHISRPHSQPLSNSCWNSSMYQFSTETGIALKGELLLPTQRLTADNAALPSLLLPMPRRHYCGIASMKAREFLLCQKLGASK